ncbi:GlxA family transcriptional regulator [Shimia abyssi]|uniref:AraC family transcriptional regulator n=1 Tax=Shimia abyssi TaxID=1662395 RepID=A0A2P8FAE7_9RHOB|nr:helix-turn-helix domain-containing protein [Shimia abyssi]PSL18632.1 AraC family transcriptional regulator [Shimia abyssi]
MGSFDATNAHPATPDLALKGLVYRMVDFKINRSGLRGDQDSPVTFEIHVQPGFSHLELSGVLTVLRTANDILNDGRFSWRITSDAPGLVSSIDTLLVRTEPSIADHLLSDCLIVVGGADCAAFGSWPKRVRAMRRDRRPVMLFSEAASQYIKFVDHPDVTLTTHWRDMPILTEAGFRGELTTRLGEVHDGVMTCAGESYVMEATIHLIADLVEPDALGLLANQLLIENVRGFERDQPKGISGGENFLEKRLRQAIAIMERTTEEPQQISQIANQVGVSPRQLERLFNLHLNQSPAKFYRTIRVKRAHIMITETKLRLAEVAIACGFASTSSLSQAYRKVYGRTPTQATAQKNSRKNGRA